MKHFMEDLAFLCKKDVYYKTRSLFNLLSDCAWGTLLSLITLYLCPLFSVHFCNDHLCGCLSYHDYLDLAFFEGNNLWCVTFSAQYFSQARNVFIVAAEFPI